jgi:hypothetical protein
MGSCVKPPCQVNEETLQQGPFRNRVGGSLTMHMKSVARQVGGSSVTMRGKPQRTLDAT